jgi:hypothetical protein
MGSVMLLAAAGDVRMLVCGGVLGAKRIARPLWRIQHRLVFDSQPASTDFADFLGSARALYQCIQRKGGVVLMISSENAGSLSPRPYRRNPESIQLLSELDCAKMPESTPAREVEAPQRVQRWPQL